MELMRKKALLRILILLIFTCLISNTTLGALGNISPEREVFTDISGHQYENAIVWLHDIGIMTGYGDNSYKPDSLLTRAEFTAIASRMTGIWGNAGISGSGFKDVPDTHWASADIELMTGLGAIEGHDGLFSPDDHIKFEEAIKILATMAGFNHAAEAAGGYPGGYLSVAVSAGISSGVKPETDGKCTRGMVAKLVRNTLETEMMTRESYGDTSGIRLKRGKTMLEEYHGIRMLNGIIYANEYYGIYDYGKAAKGKVIVGGISYGVGNSGAENLVGCSVVMYVRDYTHADGEIVSLEGIESRNDILDIDAYDIIHDSSSIDTIVYTDNDRQRTVSIPGFAYVIHNGMTLTDFTLNDIAPRIGMLRLIDNNRDGNYDVLHVISYRNIQAGSISTFDYSVRDKQSGNVFVLDESLLDMVSIVKNGKGANFIDIKADDVLSVARSNNGEAITVVISDARVSGIVKEVDSENETVVVRDEVYHTAWGFIGSPTVGNNEEFFLDFTGKIAYAGASKGDGTKYGVLLGGANDGSISNIVKFKIFNENGSASVYECKDKIAFNDGTTASFEKTPVKAVDVLNNSRVSEGGKVKNQLVRYRLNDEGKLSELELAYNGALDEETREKVFEFIPVTTFRGLGSTPRMLDNKYVIDSKTIVFAYLDYPAVTLADGSQLAATVINEDNIMLATGALIEQDATYTNMACYDLTRDNGISVIVLGTRIPTISPMMVVHQANIAVDKDGEQCVKINGFVNGNETSYLAPIDLRDYSAFAAQGRLASELKPGEVIQYTLNTSNDNLLTFRMLYSHNPTNEGFKNGYNGYYEGRADTGQLNFFPYDVNSPETYGTLYVAKAKVYKILNGYLLMNVYDPSDPNFTTGNRLCETSGARVFIYDSSRNTLRKGSLSDLSVGDEIFSHVYAYRTRDLVILK